MNTRRAQYLTRIGIPLYELRRRGDARGGAPAAGSGDGARGAMAEAEAEAVPAAEAGVAAASVAPAMEAGVAEASVAPAAEAGVAPASAVSGSAAATVEAWRELEARVAACTLCGLHRGRLQTVFGVGRREAALMIIGEAPGAEEDRQGEPFVGRAGRLLNAMLRAIGFAREDVFIANILKCRPPNNRDPSPEESATCTQYLQRQIALVQPRALLGVGRIAAQWLLQTDSPIGRLRGHAHRFGAAGIPLIVTYHPAYLLRSPLAKAKTWQDLCMVKQAVAERSRIEDEDGIEKTGP